MASRSNTTGTTHSSRSISAPLGSFTRKKLSETERAKKIEEKVKLPTNIREPTRTLRTSDTTEATGSGPAERGGMSTVALPSPIPMADEWNQTGASRVSLTAGGGAMLPPTDAYVKHQDLEGMLGRMVDRRQLRHKFAEGSPEASEVGGVPSHKYPSMLLEQAVMMSDITYAQDANRLLDSKAKVADLVHRFHDGKDVRNDIERSVEEWSHGLLDAATSEEHETMMVEVERDQHETRQSGKNVEDATHDLEVGFKRLEQFGRHLDNVANKGRIVSYQSISRSRNRTSGCQTNLSFYSGIKHGSAEEHRTTPHESSLSPEETAATNLLQQQAEEVLALEQRLTRRDDVMHDLMRHSEAKDRITKRRLAEQKAKVAVREQEIQQLRIYIDAFQSGRGFTHLWDLEDEETDISRFIRDAMREILLKAQEELKHTLEEDKEHGEARKRIKKIDDDVPSPALIRERAQFRERTKEMNAVIAGLRKDLELKDEVINDREEAVKKAEGENVAMKSIIDSLKVESAKRNDKIVELGQEVAEHKQSIKDNENIYMRDIEELTVQHERHAGELTKKIIEMRRELDKLEKAAESRAAVHSAHIVHRNVELEDAIKNLKDLNRALETRNQQLNDQVAELVATVSGFSTNVLGNVSALRSQTGGFLHESEMDPLRVCVWRGTTDTLNDLQSLLSSLGMYHTSTPSLGETLKAATIAYNCDFVPTIDDQQRLVLKREVDRLTLQQKELLQKLRQLSEEAEQQKQRRKEALETVRHGVTRLVCRDSKSSSNLQSSLRSVVDLEVQLEELFEKGDTLLTEVEADRDAALQEAINKGTIAQQQMMTLAEETAQPMFDMLNLLSSMSLLLRATSEYLHHAIATPIKEWLPKAEGLSDDTKITLFRMMREVTNQCPKKNLRLIIDSILVRTTFNAREKFYRKRMEVTMEEARSSPEATEGSIVAACVRVRQQMSHVERVMFRQHREVFTHLIELHDHRAQTLLKMASFVKVFKTAQERERAKERELQEEAQRKSEAVIKEARRKSSVHDEEQIKLLTEELLAGDKEKEGSGSGPPSSRSSPLADTQRGSGTLSVRGAEERERESDRERVGRGDLDIHPQRKGSSDSITPLDRQRSSLSQHGVVAASEQQPTRRQSTKGEDGTSGTGDSLYRKPSLRSEDGKPLLPAQSEKDTFPFPPSTSESLSSSLLSDEKQMSHRPYEPSGSVDAASRSLVRGSDRTHAVATGVEDRDSARQTRRLAPSTKEAIAPATASSFVGDVCHSMDSIVRSLTDALAANKSGTLSRPPSLQQTKPAEVPLSADIDLGPYTATGGVSRTPSGAPFVFVEGLPDTEQERLLQAAKGWQRALYDGINSHTVSALAKQRATTLSAGPSSSGTGSDALGQRIGPTATMDSDEKQRKSGAKQASSGTKESESSALKVTELEKELSKTRHHLREARLDNARLVADLQDIQRALAQEGRQIGRATATVGAHSAMSGVGGSARGRLSIIKTDHTPMGHVEDTGSESSENVPLRRVSVTELAEKVAAESKAKRQQRRSTIGSPRELANAVAGPDEPLWQSDNLWLDVQLQQQLRGAQVFGPRSSTAGEVYRHDSYPHTGPLAEESPDWTSTEQRMHPRALVSQEPSSEMKRQRMWLERQEEMRRANEREIGTQTGPELLSEFLLALLGGSGPAEERLPGRHLRSMPLPTTLTEPPVLETRWSDLRRSVLRFLSAEERSESLRARQRFDDRRPLMTATKVTLAPRPSSALQGAPGRFPSPVPNSKIPASVPSLQGITSALPKVNYPLVVEDPSPDLAAPSDTPLLMYSPQRHKSDTNPDIAAEMEDFFNQRARFRRRQRMESQQGSEDQEGLPVSADEGEAEEEEEEEEVDVGPEGPEGTDEEEHMKKGYGGTKKKVKKKKLLRENVILRSHNGPSAKGRPPTASQPGSGSRPPSGLVSRPSTGYGRTYASPLARQLTAELTEKDKAAKPRASTPVASTFGGLHEEKISKTVDSKQHPISRSAHNLSITPSSRRTELVDKKKSSATGARPSSSSGTNGKR